MMSRRWSGGKLVIASHNEGKVREIRALLEPFGAEITRAGIDHFVGAQSAHIIAAVRQSAGAANKWPANKFSTTA